jgi:outer membrane protein TolC
MFPFPGKKALAGEVAQSGVRINASNTDVYQRNLIQSVKKEYVMLYAAQRRIEVNAESQSLVKQMIASAEARYGVAQASQADILKLQIELSKLMNERAALEHDLRVPIAMINTLRSMPVDAVIGRLAEIELDPYSFDLEQLTAKALNQRPELKTMQYEIDMNNSELAMWKKERLPDFMVGASYNQMPEITNTWEVMFGINISIAPWASGKYSGKIEESKQNIRRVEQSRMDMSNMVVFEVYDSWIKGKAHWEIADRLKRTMIPQAEQALQSLLIAYQTHQTDFLSLLDSFRMLNMYRMEYFMEIADHLMHVADLERAVGGELK